MSKLFSGVKVFSSVFLSLIVFTLEVLGVVLILSLIVSSLCSLMAGSEQNLKKGDQLAQELLEKIEQSKAKAGVNPFYQGIPTEASLAPEELKGRADQRALKDIASQMILNSSHTRPQFKMDPQKDPLLTGAEKVIGNPLESIGGKGTKVKLTASKGKDETLSCEEPGEESLETCTAELLVKVIPTTIKKEWKSHFYFVKEHGMDEGASYLACRALRQRTLNVSANKTGDITDSYKACMQELKGKANGTCLSLTKQPFKPEQIKKVVIESYSPPPAGLGYWSRGPYFYTYCVTYVVSSGSTSYHCTPRIKITYEEGSHKVLPDEWISSCNRLEEKVDQGLCSYGPQSCTSGAQTRIINGVPITRDCWQKTYTYSCSYPTKNDCGPLRARGCTQIGSKCKQKVGNTCIAYTQAYQCKGSTTTGETIVGGNASAPFCLDGSCRDQSWDTNNEMMSSLAQLSLFKEMQGQIKNGLFIFTGSDDRCSKCPLSFKDCCGSGKGWGKSLHLTDCSAEENVLHQKCTAGLCHYVGTYCAIKRLGICTKKKSTYCCFGSKLLKAFHEQGRPQINLGWGSAKEPICRGFTVEEIQRIDFSKLDLREVFEDLMRNFKPSKMDNVGGKINDRMTIIQRSLQAADPKKKKPVRQRPEA